MTDSEGFSVGMVDRRSAGFPEVIFPGTKLRIWESVLTDSTNQQSMRHSTRTCAFGTALGLIITAGTLVPPLAAETKQNTAAAGGRLTVRPSVQVDVHYRGEHGATALHWMAFQGNEAMVKKLIDAGAGVNDRLDKGSTPLHLAAYNGHTAVVEILVKSGADIDARTRSGVTALYWARRNEHPSVVALLISHGARAMTGGEIAAANERESAAQKQFATDTDRYRRSSAEKTANVPYHEIRLEELREFSRVNRILAKYRPPTNAAEEPDAAQPPPRSAKRQRQDNPGSDALFRIQLGAFSSENRALQARVRYAARHSDLLDQQDFGVETFTRDGITYYRLRSSPMPGHTARPICNRLQQRGQACFVIGPMAP